MQSVMRYQILKKLLKRTWILLTLKLLLNQPVKVQNKIYKILEIIEYQQFIPSKYIELLKGTEGLYETKFSLGSNTWRVFCFFDEGFIVILLNGFQKKSQKTPKKEIDLAIRLKREYFQEKRKGTL
jgi:phage-related protein